MNQGNCKFTDVATPAGCDEKKESRGVAVVDLNRDGKLDLVINNNNARPTIYLNKIPSAGNWLSLKIKGNSEPIEHHGRSNRDALGAKVTVQVRDDTGNEKEIVRWVEAGSGYASQSEASLHFGLGSNSTLEAITIRWPNGNLETIDNDHLPELMNQECIIEEAVGIRRFPKSN
jgi:hypothetical protein